MSKTELVRKKSTYSDNFTNHFRDRDDLKPIEKYVYLDLLNRAGQKGHSWYSLDKLASIYQMSKPTLIKILNVLEAKGGLYICKRYDKTTKVQKTNRIYAIENDYYTGEFNTAQLEALKVMYPDKKIYVDSNDCE